MNKYKSLARNTIIFAIGTFGSKLLNFLLIRFYTGIMPKGDFGDADAIVQTANFLIPIFTLSMAEAVIRFGMEEGYSKHEVFSSGMTAMLCGFAGLALLMPITNMFEYIHGEGFLLFLYVCASGMRSICAHFSRAKGLVKLFALDGIMATLSLFLFNILFLSVFNMGIKGYLLSIILSDFCSAAFLMFFARLYRYLDIRAVRKDILKTMLKFALPLIPTTIMWSVTSVSDRLFVRYYSGTEINGLYSAAYKLPNLISIVSTIFFMAWNMSSITEYHSKSIGKFYTVVFGAYQSVMFIASAGLILLLKPISMLLLDKEYLAAVEYMPVLVMAVLIMSFAQFLSSVYSTTQHTVNSFVTSLIAAAVNIILNILLIPKYGAQGAAVATLISYFASYIARAIDTRRYIKFDVNHAKVFINLILLIGMSMIFLFEIKGWAWYLTGITAVVGIINFSAVLKTVKELLKRRSGAEA